MTYTEPGAKMAGLAAVKLSQNVKSLMSKQLLYSDILL